MERFFSLAAQAKKHNDIFRASGHVGEMSKAKLYAGESGYYAYEAGLTREDAPLPMRHNASLLMEWQKGWDGADAVADLESCYECAHGHLCAVHDD